MKFEELTERVIIWADEKGLLAKDNARNQLLKTLEELGEVSRAELKNDEPEIIDGLGDVLVTLIIYAETKELNLVECLESAYNVIKDRKGKKVNGIFIKE